MVRLPPGSELSFTNEVSEQSVQANVPTYCSERYKFESIIFLSVCIRMKNSTHYSTIFVWGGNLANFFRLSEDQIS